MTRSLSIFGLRFPMQFLLKDCPIQEIDMWTIAGEQEDFFVQLKIHFKKHLEIQGLGSSPSGHHHIIRKDRDVHLFQSSPSIANLGYSLQHLTPATKIHKGLQGPGACQAVKGQWWLQLKLYPKDPSDTNPDPDQSYCFWMVFLGPSKLRKISGVETWISWILRVNLQYPSLFIIRGSNLDASHLKIRDLRLPLQNLSRTNEGPKIVIHLQRR